MLNFDKTALKGMPTIHQGQCCDCKQDTGSIRVWICRVGGGVTIEQLIDGRWEIVAGGCYDEDNMKRV